MFTLRKKKLRQLKRIKSVNPLIRLDTEQSWMKTAWGWEFYKCNTLGIRYCEERFVTEVFQML